MRSPGDDPLNATDPLGLCVKGFGFICKTIHKAAHAADKVRHATANALDKTRHFVAANKKAFATAGIFIATIPLDETGAGEAIDAEAVTADAVDDGASQVVRHYTTDEGAAGIRAQGSIQPSADGNTYLTPDSYADGPSAQAGLNLDKTPTGYFELPTPPGSPPPTPVAGGTGTEIPIPGPVPLPPGTFFNPF